MRILIIENNDAEVRFISERVELVGYKKPEHVTSVHDGIDYLSTGVEFDIVLIGTFEKVATLSTLSLVCKSTSADVFVLGKDFSSPFERALAYDCGASFVNARPYHIDLLLAYIRWVARRNSGVFRQDSGIHEITTDLRVGKVYFNGIYIRLTKQEYRVFLYMLENKGRIVSTSEMLEHVCTRDTNSNVVNVVLSRVRRKIRRIAGYDPIVNTRGLGYQFCNALIQEAG